MKQQRFNLKQLAHKADNLREKMLDDRFEAEADGVEADIKQEYEIIKSEYGEILAVIDKKIEKDSQAFTDWSVAELAEFEEKYLTKERWKQHVENTGLSYEQWKDEKLYSDTESYGLYDEWVKMQAPESDQCRLCINRLEDEIRENYEYLTDDECIQDVRNMLYPNEPDPDDDDFEAW